MDRNISVDTPWGPMRPEGASPLSDQTRSMGSVRVGTAQGLAETSFHVDLPGGAIPENLRVVMFGAYVGVLDRTPRGQSTLMVGGAPMGWRAMARIDPATGDLLRDEIGVSLVNGRGKFHDEFPKAEESVRAAVGEALGAAVSADPGLMARIYAGLLGEIAADLDGDVERAERELAELRARRDRAYELAVNATDSAAPAAPAP